MLIYRDLLEEIKFYLKRKEYIAIVGPRQSGKTTLLEMLKDYLIEKGHAEEDMVQTVTFEDRRLLAEFEADPAAFLRSYFPPSSEKAYFFIDEFQYAENGGQKLKLLFDTNKNIKIIITGSSSLDIKAQTGKYMVGRILTFHLYPFNFAECLKADSSRLEHIYRNGHEHLQTWIQGERIGPLKSGKDIFSEEMTGRYEHYCVWGGYPAVVLSDTDREREKILSEILNGYIMKDIKTLLELATDSNLLSLSRYCAVHAGNLINYQKIGEASGLNYRQVKKHLNILKATMICREVRPFFKNRQKELTKNPKIFFFDTGFRNSLMENMNSLEKRSDKGAIVENAVFIRLTEMSKGQDTIHFYRTKAGAEVDFIYRTKGAAIPVEVKYSSMNREKVSRSFASFITSFVPSRGIILTKDFWGRTTTEKTDILFAPAYYL